MKKFAVAVVAGLGLLAFQALAFAQAPTGPAYGGVGPEVDEQVGGAAAEVGVRDVLPFTGLDLALATGAGLVLLALGLMMRRTARSRG